MEALGVRGEDTPVSPSHIHTPQVEGQYTWWPAGREKVACSGAQSQVGSEDTGQVRSPGGPTLCPTWDHPRSTRPMVLSHSTLRRLWESSGPTPSRKMHILNPNNPRNQGHHPKAPREETPVWVQMAGHQFSTYREPETHAVGKTGLSSLTKLKEAKSSEGQPGPLCAPHQQNGSSWGGRRESMGAPVPEKQGHSPSEGRTHSKARVLGWLPWLGRGEGASISTQAGARPARALHAPCRKLKRESTCVNSPAV